ncbi:MAG TPA: radical SAM protein [Acidimicrobiales bacterium]|nr:radical SAM protein [Acidimicrobiales bacterium]
MSPTAPATTLTVSAYAVRAKLDGGGAVWSSTRTGHHVLVTEADDAALTSGALEPLAAHGALSTLVDAGLVVPSDWDERGAARESYREDRDRTDELLLTISPTVACNLRCGYCFEAEHHPRAMSRSDQDHLVAHVQRALKGRRSLSVTWFGGEPLLQAATVLSLSRRLMRVASYSGATYSAAIITNGTLITPELAADLRAARVATAQITVDGTPDVHDLLRPTASGRGSFEATLRGVAAAHAAGVGVELRVNIDRRNAPKVPALLDLLAERGLFVDLGFVRTEPPAVFGPELVGAVERTYLEVGEFAQLEIDLLEHARSLGFRVGVGFDTATSTPCAAVRSSHLAIEPGGRVKRCWADVADDDRTIGSLGALGLTVTAADDRWRDYEPFDTGCETCPFLPVCWGGCPKARLDGAMALATDPDERRRFKERYVCTPRKTNWSELVRRGFLAG